MIERRFRAAFRKYKLAGLAVSSLLGLASVLAVNIAGFLILLPRPLWGLVDAGFVTSYLMRFSTILALAFLASRYSVYIVSSALGVVCGPLAVISLLIKKSGRRLVRIKGYEAALDVGKLFVIRHHVEENRGTQAFDYESLFKWIYKSAIVRTSLAIMFIMGRVRGGIEWKVEYYSLPLQVFSIIIVLSSMLTTFSGGILIILLAALLLAVLPPSLSDEYFNTPYFENGVSIFSVLKFKPWKLLSLQKITLLALTLSFASGMLHHRSVTSETEMLEFSGSVKASGSIVVSAISGLIIYSAADGYQFIPFDGTRINIPPPDSEVHR